MAHHKEKKQWRIASNDPIGILVLAVPFICGGLMMLMQEGDSAAVGETGGRSPSSAQLVSISESAVRGCGAIGVIMGVGIVYVYLRERPKNTG